MPASMQWRSRGFHLQFRRRQIADRFPGAGRSSSYVRRAHEALPPVPSRSDFLSMAKIRSRLGVNLAIDDERITGCYSAKSNDLFESLTPVFLYVQTNLEIMCRHMDVPLRRFVTITKHPLS